MQCYEAFSIVHLPVGMLCYRLRIRSPHNLYSHEELRKESAMARKKRDKKSCRNERMHNVSSPSEKVKEFRGYTIEGIPVYVWVFPPKDCEHDLS